MIITVMFCSIPKVKKMKRINNQIALVLTHSIQGNLSIISDDVVICADMFLECDWFASLAINLCIFTHSVLQEFYFFHLVLKLKTFNSKMKIIKNCQFWYANAVYKYYRKWCPSWKKKLCIFCLSPCQKMLGMADLFLCCLYCDAQWI